MTAVFLVCWWKRNNGLVDIGWGLGFMVLGWWAWFNRQYPEVSSALWIQGMVTLWGLRLAGYLFRRNWNKPEDWRYAQWRAEWGRHVLWRSYLQVFMLQGALMLAIALPVLAAQATATAGDWYSWPLLVVGVFLFLFGWIFEVVGDAQLAAFKQLPENKGRIMRYGLWRYTRHPNYFGEACLWWGIFVVSLISAHQLTDVLLRAVGPVLITFLLLRVSGVVMLEKKYKGNAEYEQYIQSTNAFIPWPPKRRTIQEQVACGQRHSA